jgi:anti-anti-sigma factor
MIAAGLAILDNHRWLEVRVLTDLTLRNAAAIRNGILSAWDERGRPGPLILDLAGVWRMDSSGAGTLLEIWHRAEDAGVRLEIHGLRHSPRRLLQRTGLADLFSIAETPAEALSA